MGRDTGSERRESARRLATTRSSEREEEGLALSATEETEGDRRRTGREIRSSRDARREGQIRTADREDRDPERTSGTRRAAAEARWDRFEDGEKESRERERVSV